MWCAKWRIRLNLEKTKVIIFSKSIQKNRTQPKTVWRDTKSLSSSEISGNYFRLPTHFQKALRGHPGPLHYQVLPGLLANKKWGPSPSTLIQIYQQCILPNFKYGPFSTIATSDFIISKIQRLQNKFIRLAHRLPKYVCPKLLHDSSGRPYVKDVLLSCAFKSLDRIAQNPLVEESISSNRLNSSLDHFPMPLSVVRPVSL